MNIMAYKVIFVLILVCLFGCFETVQYSSKKLLIDHDGGADDAFAITLSLLNEKYFDGPELVALTTTFGNVNLSQAIINTDRILALVDRKDVPLVEQLYPRIILVLGHRNNLLKHPCSIPVYSGAHHALISDLKSDLYYGYDGLGDDGYEPSGPIKVEDEHAAVALIELSKKYEGKLIITAIGPLTNIALAIRLDPKFIGRLAQLYVGAGHIHSEAHPKPEFNANMDPEAYRIVADNAILDKVTFVAFSQIHLSLTVSRDWRRNVLGKIETPVMQALNGFERVSSGKKNDWKELDPAVAAITLNNDIVDEFRNVRNNIILEGENRGKNTNNFSSPEPNGRVVYVANVEKYKKFLIDIYSAELKN